MLQLGHISNVSVVKIYNNYKNYNFNTIIIREMQPLTMCPGDSHKLLSKYYALTREKTVMKCNVTFPMIAVVLSKSTFVCQQFIIV